MKKWETKKIAIDFSNYTIFPLVKKKLRLKMKEKIEKRFQLLLTEQEMNDLKRESEKREIPASEILRMGLRNEISKRTNLDRINAVHKIYEFTKGLKPNKI